MKRINIFAGLMVVSVACFGLLFSPRFVAAHCDTMDGPVVQDARKALVSKDVTPVLKWVQLKDEKGVKAAFKKALTEQGKKQQQVAEKKFFESLVKVHRAGEGAPFTGLKPAGEVEPVIVEADKSLTVGSPDGLIKIVSDMVNQGVRQRYEKVAEALKHKDESVQKGREYVAAYIEYTHYVERLQMDAERHAAHNAEAAPKKHAPPKHEHGH
ncbi:DUF6448 family protein [Pelobacter propionicus]|uniref:DUF4142 domain-containing protein n=1 Tax=Pelobacter propionicus (strain DSM 2379 / NBRC 103807 / OttBd1) TaxID=338966 RepID=A0R7Z3_PELPD|nr:DUF6448 family protein [Pelobacter propionicus]ABL01289.1 conserved hypothetical protein [Pelobacter propionicus DSM 2379]